MGSWIWIKFATPNGHTGQIPFSLHLKLLAVGFILSYLQWDPPLYKRENIYRKYHIQPRTHEFFFYVLRGPTTYSWLIMHVSTRLVYNYVSSLLEKRMWKTLSNSFYLFIYFIFLSPQLQNRKSHFSPFSLISHFSLSHFLLQPNI